MTHPKRTFAITVGCIGVAVLAIALFFCSAIGLPEAKLLTNKAPSDSSSSAQIASVSELRNLFPALDASAGNKGHEHYALQIARMVDTTHKQHDLPHQLRIAAYVRAHFSRDQRRALLLNLAYFGDQQHGIATAAAHFYQAKPSQLTVAQGATLVGSLQRPMYFSPTKHPDHALDRRNAVLDAMVSEGSLTSQQADAAKAEPLLPLR